MPKRKLPDSLEDSKEVPEQTSVPLTDGDMQLPERTTATFLEPYATDCTDRTHGYNIPSTSPVGTHNASCEQTTYKRKKSVRFSGVTVYLFPRTQGFTCVPSSGGTTLGMTHEHSAVKTFSLAEHEQECRTSRTQYLLRKQQTIQRDSDEESVEEEECEAEEDDNEEDDEESEEVEDAYSFPVAISFRHRKSLLKEAGIHVDASERSDCQVIRNSREACGCQCQNVCIPSECSCSLNRINCQVDRYSYPCGCTKEGCQNASGRVEFNPTRVKTHFLSTFSRVTTENSHTTSTELSEEFVSYSGQDISAVTGSPADTYSQEPYTQASQLLEYDYAYTSLQSTSSCHTDTATSAVSMALESYSRECQANYDYYHMQPVYSINPSPATISNEPCNGYLPNESGTCFYRGTTNCMISPVMEFNSSEELSNYSSLPNISFANLTSREVDLNNAYRSSPSEGTSGDSSSSNPSAETLDFGELIKQSLVETVTA